MVWEFSQRSLDKLETCEDELQMVAHRAIVISPYDFGVTHGVRTLGEQKALVDQGMSMTMNSRHLPNENGKSEALDFAVYVNGELTWEVGYYRKVMQAFVTAAIECNVQIELGGLWKDFVDACHVQLKR